MKNALQTTTFLILALFTTLLLARPTAANTDSRVIVSVIDSGINPYHDFFNAGGEIYANSAPSSVTPAILSELGIDSNHILTLTRTGDFSADFAADQALWSQVNAGELYWFAGTNVLAISFAPGSRIIMPDDSGDTHGVGTSAAVLRANPEAIMLFVEGISDTSEAYAFNHPAVDIVSTSYGLPGSLPVPDHINNSFVGVVEQGKLHFGAADNSPATAPQDGTAGPWWSIGVAGFEEHSSEGRQLSSGTLMDFVGDFTQTLPYCADCESGQQSGVGGTSFATPRSAGTASKILLETRRALGHTGGIDTNGTPTMAAGNGQSVTNWQLRRAMEEAAYFPSVYDYDLIGGLLDMAAPVLDPVPWATVGWGVITPDTEHEVVEQALAQLGIAGTVTRTKDFATCQFMSVLMQARKAYWDTIVVPSESWMSFDDSYISC